MKKKPGNHLSFIFIGGLFISLVFCSCESNEKNQQGTYMENNNQITFEKSNDKLNQAIENADRTVKRKYRFPSMMVESDMVSRFINGEEQSDILTSLVIKGWKVATDRYGRLCKYVSPEMTYAELQDTLNFHDDDVIADNKQELRETTAAMKEAWSSCNLLEYDAPSLTNILFKKEDETLMLESFESDAVIKTEWLTCYIKYIDNMYKGKDKSMRLKVVVVDNKVQDRANTRAQYDKDKGIIRTIMDFFDISPHYCPVKN